MRIIVSSLLAALMLHAQNAPQVAAKPAAKEAPKEAAASPLSAKEVETLAKLEADSSTKSTERKNLEAGYQTAIIAEQQAFIALSNTVRLMERTKCGKNEALAKAPAGWSCVALPPQQAQ